MRPLVDLLAASLLLAWSIPLLTAPLLSATEPPASAAALAGSPYIPLDSVSLPATADILSPAGSAVPEGLDPAQVRVMVVTGDIIPGRRTNARIVEGGDFAYPFYETVDILKAGDLRVANLEAPLVSGCPYVTGGMGFCGDPRFVEGMQYAGVDVANLANNHSGDYGPQGREETAGRLAEAGIDVTGNGEVLYRDVRGMRFAFLGYNGVGPLFDRQAIVGQIAAAHQEADVVVALFHWGAEYVAIPTAAPGIAGDDPRAIARLAIDAGADLVLGNHPHWVQGIEVYNDRLIAYAHGNFIFDQSWSRATEEGVIGRYTFYGNRLVAVRYYPVLIPDEVQPRPLEGEEAEVVLDRMRQATAYMEAHPW